MGVDNKVLFGIAAPQIHTRSPVDPGEIQTYFQRAEALGFHSIWVQEQAGLRAAAGALEGVSMLSYAAALTRRVRLGAAVFLINLRNPIQLAKSLASLDQLSQGRLIVGVGLGAVTRLYQAYGLSSERRVARFIEAFTLMQKLWTEEDLSFEGQFWQIKNASLLPKPVQKPHPPLWFGANAPAALRRAVKRGSGFIGAGSSSTADFKVKVQIVLPALAEAKKDPVDFTIGKRVYLAVDANRERAVERLREWFGLYYGKAELADRVAVWGSPEECAAQLGEIISAGARLLLLNPVFDMMDHLEILAGEIIPRISDR
ncbi:MAG: LLM class flavin-dependent oxidoreductase [Candidatus Binatia bacterium]